MTKLAANWVSTCAEFPVSNIHTGLSFPFLLCWPPVLTRIEFSCEKYFMAQSLVVDSELKCICICGLVFEKSVVGSAPCCGRWAGIPQTFAGTLLRIGRGRKACWIVLWRKLASQTWFVIKLLNRIFFVTASASGGTKCFQKRHLRWMEHRGLCYSLKWGGWDGLGDGYISERGYT